MTSGVHLGHGVRIAPGVSKAQSGVAILPSIMREPLVYVLVINWNGKEHLTECFDTLRANTYGNARFFLIDNASSDGSVDLVRERYRADPRVEILACPENLGWSRGNNVGLERALADGADYVFLLNNDTAVAPDAIARLIAAAEARPNVGGLAPKMLLYTDTNILNSVGIECAITGSAWDLGIGRLDGPRWNAARPVAGICGGAAFFRCEALRKSGLLPTDFGIYLDDLDLCLRIWNAGYSIVTCPEAVVRHKFGATMGQGKHARRKYYLNTRNRFYLVLRNFPFRRALRVKLALIAGETRAVGRALLDGQPWRARAHVQAWGAALAYLPHATRERLRARRENRGHCRFWHLIRTDRLFFKGTELPENGWYAPRPIAIAGAMDKTAKAVLSMMPMSRSAVLRVRGGRLRVVHANPYPDIAETSVSVRQHGNEIAQLSSRGVETADLEVETGELTFQSDRIFEAEETGQQIDIGGWIHVEAEDEILGRGSCDAALAE